MTYGDCSGTRTWRAWLPSYLAGGYRRNALSAYDLSRAEELLRQGRYADAQTELEGAIMSCLEKLPARRPQTARDLIQLVSRSPAALKWSIEEADHWWGRHERGLAVDQGAGSSGTGAPPTKMDSVAKDYGQTVVGATDLT